MVSVSGSTLSDLPCAPVAPKTATILAIACKRRYWGMYYVNQSINDQSQMSGR